MSVPRRPPTGAPSSIRSHGLAFSADASRYLSARRRQEEEVMVAVVEEGRRGLGGFLEDEDGESWRRGGGEEEKKERGEGCKAGLVLYSSLAY
jgi:hypothetical protein